MDGSFFYAGVISFAVGVFVGSFTSYPFPILFFAVLIGLGLVAIGRRKSAVSFESKKGTGEKDLKEGAFSAPYLLLVGLSLCICVCGYARMQIAVTQANVSHFSDDVGKSVTFVGVVASEPEQSAASKQVYVRVNSELLLVRADRFAPVTYGQEVTVHGTLQTPEPFATNGGRTFDYPGYLHAHGVSYIVSFAQVAPTGAFKGNRIIASLFKLKRIFTGNLEKVIPQPQVGLGEGLLLGVKQALGADIERSFRTVGVTHIVVLSGYNVMLVVTFVMYVLAFILPIRIRLFVGAVAVVLFACMVGLSATVIRASAMAVLVLIAKATGRTYTVMRALLLTAVAMLLVNPYLLVYDVGFQLSFVATLGLILLAPFVEARLAFMPTHLGVREFVTATISAQLLVTPILLYQMGQFSIVAIVVNVLVLPMVPIAMLLTWITGMISIVSTALALPFGYAAYLSLSYILVIVHVFASLPFASLIVPVFPFSIVVCAYLLMAIVLWRLYNVQTPHDEFVRWTILDEETFVAQLCTSQSAIPKST